MCTLSRVILDCFPVDINYNRDANHSVFKADFPMTMPNFKITANKDSKMVADKITGVTPIPDHG